MKFQNAFLLKYCVCKGLNYTVISNIVEYIIEHSYCSKNNFQKEALNINLNVNIF